jgi:hypothetical protein
MIASFAQDYSFPICATRMPSKEEAKEGARREFALALRAFTQSRGEICASGSKK